MNINRLPKVTHLKHLVAISRYGSITAASKALGVPQPTLSRSLKELEDTVGVQLVIRGQQGAGLTDSGQSFATHAAAIIKELTNAISDARVIEGSQEGHVSIGLSPVTINSIFFPALKRLVSSFPRCEITVEQLSLEVAVNRLRDGSLDIAIGNARADISFSEFNVLPLMRCPFYVVCAKGHPLEGAESLEQLQDANWWITGEFEVCRRQYEQFRTLRIHRAVRTRSHAVGIPTITDLGFLALLSSVQIQKYRTLISILPIKEMEVSGDFVLLSGKNTPQTTIVSRLVHYLKQEAEDYDWRL